MSGKKYLLEHNSHFFLVDIETATFVPVETDDVESGAVKYPVISFNQQDDMRNYFVGKMGKKDIVSHFVGLIGESVFYTRSKDNKKVIYATKAARMLQAPLSVHSGWAFVDKILAKAEFRDLKRQVFSVTLKAQAGSTQNIVLLFGLFEDMQFKPMLCNFSVSQLNTVISTYAKSQGLNQDPKAAIALDPVEFFSAPLANPYPTEELIAGFKPKTLKTLLNLFIFGVLVADLAFVAVDKMNADLKKSQSAAILKDVQKIKQDRFDLLSENILEYVKGYSVDYRSGFKNAEMFKTDISQPIQLSMSTSSGSVLRVLIDASNKNFTHATVMTPFDKINAILKTQNTNDPSFHREGLTVSADGKYYETKFIFNGYHTDFINAVSD